MITLKYNTRKYKVDANRHRNPRPLEVGDLVMVQLIDEGEVPPSWKAKLRNQRFGPCKILQKINDNAMVIDLPEGFGISPMKDL